MSPQESTKKNYRKIQGVGGGDVFTKKIHFMKN